MIRKVLEGLTALSVYEYESQDSPYQRSALVHALMICTGWVLQVLVGNKCDMDESKRAVPTSKGQALADEFGIRFFETSAKNNSNVDEVNEAAGLASSQHFCSIQFHLTVREYLQLCCMATLPSLDFVGWTWPARSKNSSKDGLSQMRLHLAFTCILWQPKRPSRAF